jgi:hypothetical protein
MLLCDRKCFEVNKDFRESEVIKAVKECDERTVIQIFRGFPVIDP